MCACAEKERVGQSERGKSVMRKVCHTAVVRWRTAAIIGTNGRSSPMQHRCHGHRRRRRRRRFSVPVYILTIAVGHFVFMSTVYQRADLH